MSNKRINTEPSEKKGLFSGKKFKLSVYATAVTVVFIAIIIGLNVIATVLAERYPIQLDMTANNDFSISDKNKEYVKKVDREVKITLCCREDDYTNGNYASLLAYNNYNDTSNGAFFEQTVALLKEYGKMNKNITVVFADPQIPSFSAYSSKYPNETFELGNVLVEATFELNGKKVERHKILDVNDLYDIDTTYAGTYGYSLIQASKVETAVTSAIYTSVSDKSYKVTIITDNGGSKIEKLASLMSQNNYEFSELNDLVNQTIPKDTDLLVIAAPTKDYSKQQLESIEDFLDLKGSLGKSVLYVASSDYGNMPNINDFLSEWGFTVGSGKVYETAQSNYYNFNTNLKLTDEKSDYTKAISGGKYTYYSDKNVPISVKFEEDENYVTRVVLRTSDTTYLQPADAVSGWKPDKSSKQGPFVGIGVGSYAIVGLEDGSKYNYKQYKSNVIVVSSIDMIDTAFTSNPAIGNLDALMATCNYAVGRETADISFDNRTYNHASFTVDNTSLYVIIAVFIGIIPLAIIVIGTVIWVRRRHL